MNLPARIVVLGGYGNFGMRICRALAKARAGEIHVAGRSLVRARRFADELGRQFPDASVRAAALDVTDPRFVRQLGAIAPIVVVHTAGPFQSQDYTVAEACLACRSHYVDLADGRAFVTGFDRLDRQARRRDVLLVTGASTLPGVSSAVVEALRREMTHLRSIETAIAPAGQTRRGSATVAAVLSYCGEAVAVLEKRRWQARTGWQDSRVVRFAPFARRVALCDVPDLALFPRHCEGLETATFHAGPEPAWQLWALWLMAALRRSGLAPNWARFGHVFEAVGNMLAPFGSDIGAMQIRIVGTTADGRTLARTWNLTARSNHGPEIPCAPAAVLARELAHGDMSARGAKPCLDLVSLDQLRAALQDFDVDWNVTEEQPRC